MVEQLITRLDKVASSLESRGFVHLAERIDAISNTIEKLARFDAKLDPGLNLYRFFLNQLKDRDNWTIPKLLPIKEQFTSRVSPSLERQKQYTFAGTGPSKLIKEGLKFYNDAIQELKKAEDGNMPKLDSVIKTLESALGALEDPLVEQYMNKHPEGDKGLAQRKSPQVQTYFQAPQAPAKKGLFSMGKR